MRTTNVASCHEELKLTVTVEPVTLRTVPLGIWFRNKPPPETALLLRRVAADNDRALVALLPAMPPPSVRLTPLYQTRHHKRMQYVTFT